MADRQPLLSVIIVNVNTRDLLFACLESLASQDILDALEVIVVENGSTDGSPEMVRRSFPFCKLVRLDETIGFGAANNVGAKSSTGPLLLFLNSDTEVHAGSLGELLQAINERPECSVAGGIIRDSHGELEHSTGCFPTLAAMVFNRLSAVLPPVRPVLGRYAHQHWTGYDRERRVDWVTGAYLWIRRSAFEGLGGFDERIFMYCEDTDLCYRARRLGGACCYFPLGSITHHRGMSKVPRPRKRMLNEALHYFAGKHYRSPRFWMTRLAFWALPK